MMWEGLEQILKYMGWQKENVQEFEVNLKKIQLSSRKLIVMGSLDNMGNQKFGKCKV